jgi:hypothetical protein
MVGSSVSLIIALDPGPILRTGGVAIGEGGPVEMAQSPQRNLRTQDLYRREDEHELL